MKTIGNYVKVNIFDKLQNKSNLAVLITLIASLFYVITGFIVKSLKGFQGYEIIFYRSIISLTINFLYLKCIGKHKTYFQNTKIQNKLLQRAILGGSGHLCYFTAFQLVENVSDIIPIMLTSPIFTCILCYFLLGEQISKRTDLSILFSFAGILCIIRPQFLFGNISSPPSQNESDGENNITKDNSLNSQYMGYVFALVFSICQSFVVIIIRAVKNQVHNTVIIQYSFFPPIMFGGLMMIYQGKFNMNICNFSNILIMFSISLFNYTAQILYSKAIQLEKASKIVPLSYSQVLFSYLIDILCLGSSISICSIFGGCLVILGSWLLIKQ